MNLAFFLINLKQGMVSMPLEKSPDLNDLDFTPEATQEAPSETNSRKKGFRYLLAGLSVMVLLMALANFGQDGLNNPQQGSGTIRGVVLDERGQPLQNAYVKIMGGDLSAPITTDGSFELQRVPAGTQSLVVLDRYTGQEIPFMLANGEILDFGTIQFKVTTEPGF
jgi:hypothetical protein